MSRESTLVTGEWAENHLNTSEIVFIETGNENTEYLKGHIPGAVWIGWNEFQDQVKLGVIGREKFEELLCAKGISNDDVIVIYSQNCNMLSALVYWYFTLYSHQSVKLLDGGRRKWELDARPLSQKSAKRPTTSYYAKGPDSSIRAMRDEVVAAIGNRNLLDVRTSAEFAGEIFAPGFAGEAFTPGNNPHEVAQRSGHVPGAINLPWEAVVNEDDTFKANEELAELYAGLDGSLGTITYCWVGARSAHTWFVLRELLGQSDVKNYDGSWAEYGSSIGVPIERGNVGY